MSSSMCVHADEDRLLQRTVCWPIRLYARATTTCCSCCCPLRCRSWSTRFHRSPDWTPLAAGTPSYYVQAVYHCTLMHRVVYGYAPQYLTDMMVPLSQLAGRSHLRSAHKGAYDTLRISTTFGSRSFSYAAPHAWNQLPADIRLISTVSTFKQHFETHLFNIAYFYWFSSSLLCPLLFSFFIPVLLFYCTCYVRCLFCKGTLSSFWLLITDLIVD